MTRISSLAMYFSETLGEQKARVVLEDACRALRLSPFNLSVDEALAVLEHVASTETGLVSITARFAKSRFHLALARV